MDTAEDHVIKGLVGEEITISLVGISEGYKLGVFGCVRPGGAEPSPYVRDPQSRAVTIGFAATSTVSCLYRFVALDDSQPAVIEADPGTQATAITRVTFRPSDKTLRATFGGLHEAELGHETGAQATVEPGVYSTDLRLAPPGYEIDSIDCDDLNGGDSLGYVEGAAAEFRLAAGESTTCTFHLVSTADRRSGIPAPKPGAWKAVNAAAEISCGGFTQRLPKTTDKGKLDVRQGGRRLIATGLSDGTRLVLDHDDKRPGSWTGKVKTSQQGASFTLNYTVKLVNEKRMEGTMSARFKAGGQQCSLDRAFELTYAD